MTGGVALKGPSVAAVLMRQPVTKVPRSTRSISTFRPQRLRVPGPRDQLNPMLSGRATWRAASAVVGPASMRFNSTVTDAPTTTGAPPAAAEGELPDIPDDLLTDISAIPEKVGYLKELGLDYGIGPSSFMQFIIEHIHMWTGLPWWASIVATGILVRVALLKPVLMASDTGAKLHNAKPVLDPLRQEQLVAMSQQDNLKATQVKAKIAQLRDDHGIQAWKSFLPMIQVPLGYGCFRVVRGMAHLPVPGLANESVAWLTDLTMADPFFLLPLASSYLLYLAFKKGGESGGMDVMNSAVGKALLYGLPGLSFAISAFFPSALQLYFMSTGLLGVGQAYLLHWPKFREYMGMTIMKKTPQSGSISSATVDANMGQTQSKGLRALYERIEAENAKMGGDLKKARGIAKAYDRAEASETPRRSWLDRMVGGAKDYGRQVSDETVNKLRQLQGTQTQESDGSSPSRLTAEEKRHAEEYEKQQRDEDEYLRSERNYKRMRSHRKALAAEREKARKKMADAQKHTQQQRRARR